MSILCFNSNSMFSRLYSLIIIWCRADKFIIYKHLYGFIALNEYFSITFKIVIEFFRLSFKNKNIFFVYLAFRGLPADHVTSYRQFKTYDGRRTNFFLVNINISPGITA